MPAGNNFLISEGMLGKCFIKHNSGFEGKDKGYFSLEIRNQALHAVHPIGWITDFSFCVNGEELKKDEYYLVLRGQWIRMDILPSISDIFWYCCEPAQLCFAGDGVVRAGENEVQITVTTSLLDQSALLDIHKKWGTRSQTVSQTVSFEEV